MHKPVVLVIASNGFQPIEYKNTREVLENSGYHVVVVSDKLGQAIDAQGTKGPQVTIRVDQLNVGAYSGVFLIGGSGALDCLDNVQVHTLMKSARDAGIAWGAICISPRILCNAGLLEHKKITGWDGDNKLKSHVADGCSNVTVVGDMVVIDGNLVTGRGPEASTDFGNAIVKVLKQQHGM